MPRTHEDLRLAGELCHGATALSLGLERRAPTQRVHGPLSALVRAELELRARAPAKASTWRGGSPRQAEVHPPVTEGYCVVATRGGELPEVNNPSVTQHHARHEAT